MSRGNRMLECPNCEETTLKVIGSEADENNVGIRRYQCMECRNTFTTLETFFTDDRGDPDCFNQIALNQRLKDRENYHKRHGSNPRRPVKSTDQIRLTKINGRVTLSYRRSPSVRALFYTCKRGHPFNKENTLVKKNTGNQICRPCRRIHQKNWEDNNRERRLAQKRVSDRARRKRKKEQLNATRTPAPNSTIAEQISA